MPECPKCKLPCPANEFAAYGRHEDCTYARDTPAGVSYQPSKGTRTPSNNGTSAGQARRPANSRSKQ